MMPESAFSMPVLHMTPWFLLALFVNMHFVNWMV